MGTPLTFVTFRSTTVWEMAGVNYAARGMVTLVLLSMWAAEGYVIPQVYKTLGEEDAWLSYSTHAVVVGVLYLLSLSAYITAAAADPGSVPHSLATLPIQTRVPSTSPPHPDDDPEFCDWSGEGTTDAVGSRHAGGDNFCEACGVFKPPRAHHCSRCRACVLRMDHHCPWLGACVGVGNYKPFVLTCIYFCATAFWNLTTLWPFLAYVIPSLGEYNDAHPYQMALVMLHLVLSLFTAGFAAILSGSHLNLISRNMTTIEAKKEMSERDGKERRRLRRHPYLPRPQYHRWDYGIMGNMRSVFGHALWSWPIPNIPPSGDGLSFPISELYKAERRRFVRLHRDHIA